MVFFFLGGSVRRRLLLRAKIRKRVALRENARRRGGGASRDHSGRAGAPAAVSREISAHPLVLKQIHS